MAFFDAHAHLPEGKESFLFPPNFAVRVCTTCESDFYILKRLRENFGEAVIPAFGIHPWFAHLCSSEWFENLKNAFAETPFAQVGEIGIDKNRADICAKEIQIAFFEKQLDFAIEMCVPATIHCVGWWGEMMEILRSRKKLPKMLFHGFSGSAEIAKELLTLGADFSFPIKKLQSTHEKFLSVLQSIPRERVYPESDAPLGSKSFKLCKSAASELHKIYDNFMNEKQVPQALFLDRDGTLIFDKDYLHVPEEVELIPGTKEAVHCALKNGCKLFLLTNQSGIGRGFFTMEDYNACHEKFLQILEIRPEDFSKCGVAPEHPDAPSKYRKPSPAFVLEQLKAFPELDPARCWMVGDRRSDWDCGINAGIRSAAVETGKPIDAGTREYLEKNNIPLFKNFAEFVKETFNQNSL